MRYIAILFFLLSCIVSCNAKKVNVSNGYVSPPTFSHQKGEKSPIHLAAESGNIQEVMNYINQGVSIDIRDEDGWTPLMYAIAAGQSDVVKMLLLNKASLDVVDSNGLTPLFLACKQPNFETFKAVIDANPYLFFVNKDKINAFMLVRYDPDYIDVLYRIGAQQAATLTEVEIALSPIEPFPFYKDSSVHVSRRNIKTKKDEVVKDVILDTDCDCIDFVYNAERQSFLNKIRTPANTWKSILRLYIKAFDYIGVKQKASTIREGRVSVENALMQSCPDYTTEYKAAKMKQGKSRASMYGKYGFISDDDLRVLPHAKIYEESGKPKIKFFFIYNIVDFTQSYSNNEFTYKYTIKRDNVNEQGVVNLSPDFSCIYINKDPECYHRLD